MGNLDQSTVHFEGAMAFCRKAGYLPELAWTCCDYADALLQREKERDRAMASSLLDESLTISTELGMRPLMERVTALQERADAQPVKASAYPDGLTQREVEVLQLICGGKTDREIAEELFISFRTVGNHVRSILNKTATANRTEAATYAALNGLTSDSGGVH
jgi:DNA-binding NarL/FixJ family response regulator